MKNYRTQDSVASVPVKGCKKYKNGIEIPKSKVHKYSQLISHKDANMI